MEATAAFQASLGPASKHGTEVQSDYILGSSESPFYAMGTSPSITSVLLAGMFWKPALPAGSW